MAGPSSGAGGATISPQETGPAPGEPTGPATSPPPGVEREPTGSGVPATSLPDGIAAPMDGSGPDALFGLFGYDFQPAIDLVDKGGPVVVVLLLLSIAATTVLLVKASQFAWLGVGSRGRLERAVRLWLTGMQREGYDLLARSRKPAARVLAHSMRGIQSGVEERVLREEVERIAGEELANMRRYMRVLEVTVQTAPLLGLFGTVLGMISAFQALQNAGADADPTVLAGGIWVALLTTAVGLAIAIPLAFVNAWLEGRIEREQQLMEQAVTSLLTGRATDVPLTEQSRPVRLAHAAE